MTDPTSDNRGDSAQASRAPVPDASVGDVETARSGRVTVIGEALIDLVPGETPQTFRALPGGSPFNTAIGLARLGVQTTLMARLSDTAFGRVVAERAQSEGLDLSAAAQASEPTSLAVVSLDDQARASYDFYVDGTADWQWSAVELSRIPVDTEILHFGSLASWTAPGAGQILDYVAGLRSRQATLVSYDPNVRPLLLRDPVPSRALIEVCVQEAHLVKASTEDIEWLYSGADPDEVARQWLGLGASVVVLTDGPDGARAHTAQGETVARPGLRVEVADTIGAGDSFTAAMLASLLRRGVTTVAGLVALEAAELSATLDDAVLASALTCRRAGADPPTLAEVERGLR